MDIKGKSDEALMELYKEGQEHAFNELYARYKGRVYGYIKCKLVSESMAEEVYQNVFLKLHRTRGLYSPRYLFAAWIFTITRTSLIDLYRTSGRYKTMEFSDNINVQTAEKEDISDIRDGLCKLTAQNKAVIDLRYFDERSYDEIAKLLQTTPINARQKVSRAIVSLRKILTGGDHDK